MSYVVGSGWWCSSPFARYHNHLHDPKGEEIYGFSRTWYDIVCKLTNPEKILIIDSDSPVKPLFWDKDIAKIGMSKNFGKPDPAKNFHDQFGIVLSGAQRALWLGVFYALFNGINYFVWLEQDCLIRGKGLIEYAIKNMGNADFSANVNENCDTKIETCFMIFRARNAFKMFDEYYSLKAVGEENKDAERKYFSLSRRIPWASLPFRGGGGGDLEYKGEEYFYMQKFNPVEKKALLA
jgi:hypothetical protein